MIHTTFIYLFRVTWNLQCNHMAEGWRLNQRYFFPPPHKCGVCLTHTVSEFHIFSSACRTGHYIQLFPHNVHPTGPWLLYWMPWDCWHRKGGAIICRISGLIAITWSPLDCEGASYFNCGAFRPVKPLSKQLDTSALVGVHQKCWRARTVQSIGLNGVILPPAGAGII